MKDDYTTNSHYLTYYTFLFLKWIISKSLHKHWRVEQQKTLQVLAGLETCWPSPPFQFRKLPINVCSFHFTILWCDFHPLCRSIHDVKADEMGKNLQLPYWGHLKRCSSLLAICLSSVDVSVSHVVNCLAKLRNAEDIATLLATFNVAAFCWVSSLQRDAQLFLQRLARRCFPATCTKRCVAFEHQSRVSDYCRKLWIHVRIVLHVHTGEAWRVPVNSACLLILLQEQTRCASKLKSTSMVVKLPGATSTACRWSYCCRYVGRQHLIQFDSDSWVAIMNWAVPKYVAFCFPFVKSLEPGSSRKDVCLFFWTTPPLPLIAKLILYSRKCRSSRRCLSWSSLCWNTANKWSTCWGSRWTDSNETSRWAAPRGACRLGWSRSRTMPRCSTPKRKLVNTECYSCWREVNIVQSINASPCESRLGFSKPD